ncbi:MAG: FAD-dependent oxidoreductase [Limisphaerales bacterium]
MNDHAGQSISLWMATATLPPFSTLAQKEHADICIVGAGVAGLTTAYLLRRAGTSVIVLDDGPIVSGETERTTAHLATALDHRYFELERLHGEEGARLAAESHGAAIDQIEQIVIDESIDCDFERLDGYLYTLPEESQEDLERELAAARHAGLSDTELLARAPLGSFDTGPAIRFPRQAQFHPLKYLAALSRAIIRDGGRIYTQTHATKIEGGKPARVETRNGAVVTADAVVVATNTPVNDLLAIHTKQASYRTFVIGATVPSGLISKALYWDTADPYHYVRLQTLRPSASLALAGEVLIVGGEDHKTGQADDAEARYGRLEAWARARFPMMTDIRFRWSGQVVEPVDGLAFIGRNPMDKPNVYVATGFSGNGMTYGTIAGRLLTDLIQGRENAWASLYDPSRKTLRAAKAFARETINVAAQYSDWFTQGDVKEDISVPAGTGALVRQGLHKVAVYCDDEGEMHKCSAVCPHLGGIVAWNTSEETWDCPCHGSRFDKFGKVLNGPAITNLPPVAVANSAESEMGKPTPVGTRHS